MSTRVAAVLALSLSLAGAACSQESPVSDAVVPLLLTVDPVGGSVDVAVNSSVTVTFTHGLGPGMEAFAALHEGSLTGPEVEGAWALSNDRTVLTFEPAAPLKPATTYFVHLGGGMTDGSGHTIDLARHGHDLGGAWATGTMMGANSGMGHGNTHMMGAGWSHPTNGSYGMVFSFTTAP